MLGLKVSLIPKKNVSAILTFLKAMFCETQFIKYKYLILLICHAQDSLLFMVEVVQKQVYKFILLINGLGRKQSIEIRNITILVDSCYQPFFITESLIKTQSNY